MVLQREPESAVVFGFDATSSSSQAILSCSKNEELLTRKSVGVTVYKDGAWRSEIPPQTAGTVCDITLVNEEEEISIKQVSM